MPDCDIIEIVENYYAFRGLTQPDTNQAFLFLVSEIGELSDALVANQASWVRNNPDRDRQIPAARLALADCRLPALAGQTDGNADAGPCQTAARL